MSSGQPDGSGVPLVAATAALFGFVGIVLILLAVGGWAAFGGAIAVMLFGVLALSRYVQRIAWTRRSARHLRRGLAGMNEDLSVTDEAKRDLSPHDFPLESPARRVLERDRRRRARQRASR